MSHYQSYSRTVLSDQRFLVDLIHKYADPKAAVVRELDKDIKQLSVITSDAIMDALHHPHSHFIQFTIQLFADYFRAVRKIAHYKDLIADEKGYIERSVQQFHHDLDEMEGDDFDKLSDIVAKLEEQYSALLDEDELLDNNLDRLSKVVGELSTLVQQQDREWNSYRDEYDKKLVDLFSSLEFPISENEKAELLSQDSWQSMLNRVAELKIELPKNIDVRNPNFGTYFQLKAYLAMYSSLSRRMLSNSPEEIQKL